MGQAEPGSTAQQIGGGWSASITNLSETDPEEPYGLQRQKHW